MAIVGYSSGIIGSMSFSKTRPRFEDIYNFPEYDDNNRVDDVERKKAEMLAWAANVNRQFRRSVKGRGK